MYMAYILAGVFAGAAVAGLSLWFVLRNAAAAAAQAARADAQIEMARFTERSSFLARQVETLQSGVGAAESRVSALQRQLEETSSERIRFQEHASRVPSLEQGIQQAIEEKAKLQSSLSEAREKLATAESVASTRGTQITNLGEEVLSLARERDSLRGDQTKAEARIAQLNTSLEDERKQSAEKLQLLDNARDRLTQTFEVIANKIFEEKSERFTDLNKTNIAQILDPLREKIQEFQSTVTNVYDRESKDRVALGVQVKQLIDLNQQLSTDANNLTNALKGSSKELGNWGEMILERILESSGLRKDSEYLIRPTYHWPDGRRAQPDSVILLPEKRSLVVDAKATLNAYDEYVHSDDEEAKERALDEHVAALRRHLEDLAETDYRNLPELNAPDFVVMFVPIESAFVVGVTRDRTLWEDGWKKGVLLVSPTSFLIVVRIVANLWTQEAQRNNFQEIARRGAALYDKLVGFVEDFEGIGGNLDDARQKFESALSKLSKGRGNVIRQAEMLKDLGVRPTKALSEAIVEGSAVPSDEASGYAGIPSSNNDAIQQADSGT